MKKNIVLCSVSDFGARLLKKPGTNFRITGFGDTGIRTD